MPATAHYRLKQKDSEAHCRCSNHIGPGDLGWPNQPQTYAAKCSDGGWQRSGETKTVTVGAGVYHAETLAAANSLALTDARTQAQALLDCGDDLVFHFGVPSKVKVMPDGKVIALGNWNFIQTLIGPTLSDPFLWPMLYRLNADGSFDSSFLGFSSVTFCDEDGNPLSYAFGASEGVNQGWDIGFDSTGRIYVCGQFLFKLSGVIYNNIARFSAAGAFDASFVCRFSNQGFLMGAPVRTLAIVNDSSIFYGGAFDHYSKGSAGFVSAVSLVNVDGARTLIATIPVGDVYHTMWNPFCSVYKLGRLYLGNAAPGFVFAGGSGPPPSDLNVAGGGLVRVSLSSTGRFNGWRNCASIPFYYPGNSSTDHVLGIDMDRDGNLYLVGFFSSFGKVPLLSGFTGNNVPRLNCVKTDPTGVIDPNFKPTVANDNGGSGFGVQVIKVLPDRNVLIAGGALYFDPSNPFPNEIVKVEPTKARILSLYPEMDGLIFGFPYAVDVTDDGLLFVGGVGGFIGGGLPPGAVQRFRY